MKNTAPKPPRLTWKIWNFLRPKETTRPALRIFLHGKILTITRD